MPFFIVIWCRFVQHGNKVSRSIPEDLKSLFKIGFVIHLNRPLRKNLGSRHPGLFRIPCTVDARQGLPPRVCILAASIALGISRKVFFARRSRRANLMADISVSFVTSVHGELPSQTGVDPRSSRLARASFVWRLGVSDELDVVRIGRPQLESFALRPSP
jgi:hypothetical protein